MLEFVTKIRGLTPNATKTHHCSHSRLYIYCSQLIIWYTVLKIITIIMASLVRQERNDWMKYYSLCGVKTKEIQFLLYQNFGITIKQYFSAACMPPIIQFIIIIMTVQNYLAQWYWITFHYSVRQIQRVLKHEGVPTRKDESPVSDIAALAMMVCCYKYTYTQSQVVDLCIENGKWLLLFRNYRTLNETLSWKWILTWISNDAKKART